MYRPRYLNKPKDNLLVIELKDIDSVPKVYYKGERVFNKGLNEVSYHWKSRGGLVDYGKQSINIKGLDKDGRSKYPVLDVIAKERGV